MINLSHSWSAGLPGAAHLLRHLRQGGRRSVFDQMFTSPLSILDKVLMLQWLDKSESYFGDESSKLSIFDHTIELQQVTKAKGNVNLWSAV